MMDMTPSSSRDSSRTGPRSPHGRMVKPLGGQGPRLGTIQMVADTIKDAKEYPSKYQLWRKLSKGMGYSRLGEILNYLESTNQVMIDKDGRIVWTLADNPSLKKLLTESTRLR